MKTLPYCAVAALAACHFAAVPAAVAGPLRAGHPIVGAWRLQLDDACVEIYRIGRDGHARITSAEEVAEAEFQIDDEPGADGFYASVNRIVKDNGKRDCAGKVTEPGQTLPAFILFHPSGDQLLMCRDRDTRACIGPLVRIPTQDV
jgi:hypothetical protein